MPRPAVSAFTTELYDGLPERFRLGEEERGWPLLLFCEGIAQMFLEVEGLVRDTDDGEPGWSALLDIDRVPSEDLGYIAQFVGVRLLVGLSDAAQRQRIRETSGQQRGKPDAIKGAARQYLTGTQRVDLFERDGGDPYKVRVRTFVTETPDQNAVYLAIMAEKPAGLVLVYELAPGMTYAELDAAWGTYADMTATGRTYAQLTAGVP
jgi:hypothetical protein